MALNRRDTRAAAIGWHIMPMLPLGDGSISQHDRQMVVGVYPDVLAGAAPPTFGYDGRITHITIEDETVTAASDQSSSLPYTNSMVWDDRP